jgi:hypothetical protein
MNTVVLSKFAKLELCPQGVPKGGLGNQLNVGIAAPGCQMRAGEGACSYIGERFGRACNQRTGQASWGM